jgi:hypothetical protein
MMAALAFLWNATRGHRLMPWRSEYLKWRIETYSGLKAETIGPRQFWRFVWQEKGHLVSFLRWTGEVRETPRQG